MRYLLIRISQDIFSRYLKDISRISQRYLPRRYPQISFDIFIHIFLCIFLLIYVYPFIIQRYLSSYPNYILGISFYLSFNILIISLDIFLLIPRSPAIYPAGFLLRFRLVRQAAACRLCIALRKLLCFISAPPGAGLSRPCDPAAGPVGARRRRVRMAGWGPLAGQLGR